MRPGVALLLAAVLRGGAQSPVLEAGSRGPRRPRGIVRSGPHHRAVHRTVAAAARDRPVPVRSKYGGPVRLSPQQRVGLRRKVAFDRERRTNASLAAVPRPRGRRPRNPAFPGRRPRKASLASLPRLVVLGCMKCGTSSLFDALLRHASESFHGGLCFEGQRCDAGNGLKEKHFYDRHWDDARPETGCAIYAGLYARAAPGSVGVDATPAYLRDARAPARAAACYGPRLAAATFVAVLRDPVARLFSDFAFRRRGWFGWRDDGRPFDARVAAWLADDGSARAAFDENLLVVGHYADQLARWRAALPRGGLVVAPSAAVYADPDAVVAGLAAIALGRARVNATGKRHGVPKYLRAARKETFDSRAAEAANYVRRTGDRLSNATARLLHAYFAPRNAALWALLADLADENAVVPANWGAGPWW